jgi:hypothetical protein
VVDRITVRLTVAVTEWLRPAVSGLADGSGHVTAAGEDELRVEDGEGVNGRGAAESGKVNDRAKPRALKNCDDSDKNSESLKH